MQMMNVFPRQKAEHDNAEIQLVLRNIAESEGDFPRQAFRRPVLARNKTGFETITKIDRNTIKKMMEKVNWIDLLTALTWSDNATKEAALTCMTERSKAASETMIKKMEHGLIERQAIERARDIVSDAFLELLRE